MKTILGKLAGSLVALAMTTSLAMAESKITVAVGGGACLCYLPTMLAEQLGEYKKAGVEIEFRLATNPPCNAHGHDGRYGQVFRNVLENSLSFSPAHSKIVLELSREPRNGPFVVTIDDEGPGIPEDNLESIFQRFYSERPTEHFGQHSGLGLSICRQIMETYGGSISASNRRAPDGRVLGARFTVRLPAAESK